MVIRSIYFFKKNVKPLLVPSYQMLGINHFPEFYAADFWAKNEQSEALVWALVRSIFHYNYKCVEKD